MFLLLRSVCIRIRSQRAVGELPFLACLLAHTLELRAAPAPTPLKLLADNVNRWQYVRPLAGAALVRLSRPRADRKGQAGRGKRLKVLREPVLHVRPVQRDEDDDDGRVNGLVQGAPYQYRACGRELA